VALLIAFDRTLEDGDLVGVLASLLNESNDFFGEGSSSQYSVSNRAILWESGSSSLLSRASLALSLSSMSKSSSLKLNLGNAAAQEGSTLKVCLRSLKDSGVGGTCAQPGANFGAAGSSKLASK